MQIGHHKKDLSLMEWCSPYSTGCCTRSRFCRCINCVLWQASDARFDSGPVLECDIGFNVNEDHDAMQRVFASVADDEFPAAATPPQRSSLAKKVHKAVSAR
jgi:hypothetical protein